jgi:DUF4097 and DUF4098 domain-containing protein YvlB
MSFVVLLMAVGGRLAAQTTTPAAAPKAQELTVPLSEPGKPFTLEAKLFDGSITLQAYEGKDVLIDIHTGKDDEKSDDNEGEGMKRIGGGTLDFSAEEHDNAVSIHAPMSSKLEGITIKIPQGSTKIVLGTVENGDIEVKDVSGEIEISNVNGSISATGISGSVVANTVNGEIIVKFKSVDPKAPMAFTSVNGKIDVLFPADIKANVKLKSDRGEMFSDFDIAVDKTQPKVEKNSEDHYYSVKIEDWVYGKLNGGGPEMMMKTMMGSIYIRKTK